MERRKISNWEACLKIMKGHFFEFDGIIQKVLSYALHKRNVEIKTTTREHYHDYDEIKLILWDWKPIAHNDIEAKNFMEEAIFEDDNTTALATLKSLGLDSTQVENILLLEMAATLSKHKEQNDRFSNKMKDILDKLDPNTVPSKNIIDTANVVSGLSKDSINQQLSEIKTLAMIQKLIEGRKKENDKPDERKE